MSKQSTLHPCLNWAKERLDEMDATLASLEAKVSDQRADAEAMASQLIADLKKRRDEFEVAAKAQADAGEAAWQAAKSQMELQWKGFEAQVEAYFKTVGIQVERQQATFRDIAAAQVKAWREMTDKFNDAVTKLAAEKRANVDLAINQMKSDAEQAEVRLQKLRQAGSESWTALGGALAESRKSFDQANQKAWDAFKRASH